MEIDGIGKYFRQDSAYIGNLDRQPAFHPFRQRNQAAEVPFMLILDMQ